MQYTGSSFVQQLVSLFAFLLWPRSSLAADCGTASAQEPFQDGESGHGPGSIVRPVFHLAGHYLPRLRVFQQGQTQYYVLYILVTVIVLLVWGMMGAGR